MSCTLLLATTLYFANKAIDWNRLILLNAMPIITYHKFAGKYMWGKKKLYYRSVVSSVG